MNPNVLEIQNLSVSFFTSEGETRAVNNVCFQIPRGKFLAMVGESGCGKSVTSYSILRLIQKPGRITQGRILFHDTDGTTTDLAALSEAADRLYHGCRFCIGNMLLSSQQFRSDRRPGSGGRSCGRAYG